jgi:hypothetical protein
MTCPLGCSDYYDDDYSEVGPMQDAPCTRRNCGCPRFNHQHYRGNQDVMVAECATPGCLCPAYRAGVTRFRRLTRGLLVCWFTRGAPHWAPYRPGESLGKPRNLGEY